MAQWYTYHMDNPGGGYGEITDPMGPYKKPDTNICVPSDIPITTWDSGLVTEVANRGCGDGGTGVTVMLDHPINGQAKAASFNYLGRVSVSMHQRVQAGTIIGYAGSSCGICFALGLGPGPYWPGAGFPQASGTSLLDPRQVINALRSGQIPSTSTVGAGSNPLTGLVQSLTGTAPLAPAFISVSNKTHELLNNVPGFVGIVDGLDYVEQFQPFILRNTGGDDIGILGHLPFVGGFAQGAANAATLPSDTMQALLVFITANAMAFFVRAIIVMAGVVLLIALVMNAVGTTFEETTGTSVSNVAATGLKIGALAAL